MVLLPIFCEVIVSFINRICVYVSLLVVSHRVKCLVFFHSLYSFASSIIHILLVLVIIMYPLAVTCSVVAKRNDLH